MMSNDRPSTSFWRRSTTTALFLPLAGLLGCNAGFEASSSGSEETPLEDLAIHLPDFFPIYQDFSLDPTDDVYALREEFDATYRSLGYRFIHDSDESGLQSSATRELIQFSAHPAVTPELERYVKDKVAHELSREVWSYFRLFERQAAQNQGGNMALGDGFNDLRRDYNNSGINRVIGDQRYLLVMGGEMETLEDWVEESTTQLDAALADGAPGADEPAWPTEVTFSMAAEQEERFSYPLPEGATHVEVRLTGGGDADLYVAYGRAPYPSDYDCRPYTASSEEVCSADVHSDVNVMVRGYADVSDVTLTVRFN